LMVNVRARENGVPLIAANKAGVEARSVAYCGKSAIVAADGTFAARASQDEQTILFGRVAVGPPLVRRGPSVPPVTRGAGAAALPESARIAIALRNDPALHESARIADADMTIDTHAQPSSSDIAIVDDEAVLDPRALIAPRLDGV